MDPIMRSSTSLALSVAVACLAVACLAACDKKPSSPPEGVPPAATASAPAAAKIDAGHDDGKVEFPEVPIRAGATTVVHVAWKTPEGTGINEEAPFRVRWNKSDALADAPTDVKATGSAAKNGFEIRVKPLDGAPNATLGGVIDIVVCDVATHSVCVPVRRTIDIEFVVNKAAAAETTVAVALPHAKAR